ncbi:hypothetical protein VKT23_017098 [Stygiomarasmius scandens]|uniref:Uncharacterized protein n=1 Tax=Marasmiellus scandens TaxID=2682957 RepID=A0ABR1IT76_9AGAR
MSKMLSEVAKRSWKRRMEDISSPEHQVRHRASVSPSTPSHRCALQSPVNTPFQIQMRPQNTPMSGTQHQTSATPSVFTTPIRHGVSDLARSSFSFLIDSSPIQSSSAIPPTMQPFQFSPVKRKTVYDDLLNQLPSTELEENLQKAMRSLIRKYNMVKEQSITMQSCMVLNSTYCEQLRQQLQAQEENRKKKGINQLMGDGMPRLLTSVEFIRRVETYTRSCEEKEKAAKEKRIAQESIAEMKAEWNRLNDHRKAENERLKAEWKEDLQIWREKKKMKIQGGPEPKWRDYCLPPIPKGSSWQRNPTMMLVVVQNQKKVTAAMGMTWTELILYIRVSIHL